MAINTALGQRPSAAYSYPRYILEDVNGQLLFSPSDNINGDIGTDNALIVLITFASIGVKVSVAKGLG